MFPKAAGVLFTLLLLAGVPALAYSTARKAEIRAAPRLALYFSAVLSQWILAGVGAWVAVSDAPPPLTGWFRAVPREPFILWTGFVTVVSIAVLWLLVYLERRGWWPAESELVYLLLPQSRREKVWCVLVVAPTAGLCEEFLYRGFLLAQLTRGFHSLPLAWIVSSIAFGLTHAYQGSSGMLRAATLGAFLAYPVVHLGTIYPAMAAHFLIDAVALGWLGPRYLARGPGCSGGP